MASNGTEGNNWAQLGTVGHKRDKIDALCMLQIRGGYEADGYDPRRSMLLTTDEKPGAHI